MGWLSIAYQYYQRDDYDADDDDDNSCNDNDNDNKHHNVYIINDNKYDECMGIFS